MLVPLLSLSGSWLPVRSYVSVAWVTLSTVKVALLFEFEILLLVTLHWPLAPVVHEPVPVVPPLQVPLTVADATGS